MNWKITETEIKNGQTIIYVKDEAGINIEAIITNESDRANVIDQVTRKYIKYIKQ